MKYTFSYAAFLALVLVAVGCNRFDDPMVIEGVGTWNIVSKVTQINQNGVLVLDSTATGALGTLAFERSGRAILTHPSNLLDTLTWEDYPKQNRLILYQKHGPWMNCDILKRTNNAMTLHWQNESDEGTVHFTKAYTMEIERVK
jgi:hypothetical protein